MEGSSFPKQVGAIVIVFVTQLGVTFRNRSRMNLRTTVWSTLTYNLNSNQRKLGSPYVEQ